MHTLSAGREPEPLQDVDHDDDLRDLLIRMTARPDLESLTEVFRLVLQG
jgi:hypothetical protein